MAETRPETTLVHRSARPGFARRLVSFLGRPGHWLSAIERRLAGLWPTPAVLHVTHYKAGSQWLYRILHELAHDRFVPSEVGSAHFLARPIRPDGVYPTLYVTRTEFESIAVPPDAKRFIVIRDLRDTLISGYFSLLYSHSTLHAHIADTRARLKNLTVEDGLLKLMKGWLRFSAAIQQSWIGSSSPLIRYEDLLRDDVAILEKVLLDHCRLRVPRFVLRQVVLANRFSARSGRKPGHENLASHERKGVAGDWKNHFTDRVAKAFKDLYGELLVTTGYESGDRW